MASAEVTCEEIALGAMDDDLDALDDAARRWDVPTVRRAVADRRCELAKPAPIVRVPTDG